MKINELKQVIKEAVKEAVREVLLEQVQAPAQPKPPKSSIAQILPESKPKSFSLNTANPLASILEDTRKSMTSVEARALLGEGVSFNPTDFQAPPIETQPDFLKNAAAIFKKSLEKSTNPLA